MAVFGLPGGAEWAVIALVLVFLFVPGALLFVLGFLTGRGAANRQTDAPAASRGPQESQGEAVASADHESDVTLTWDSRAERGDE